MVLLTILLTVVSVYLLERLYTQRARTLLAGLPSFPYTLPLVGNVLRVVRNNESIYKVLCDLTAVQEEHKKPAVFWLGPFPCVAVSEAEDVKAVASTYVSKPFYYSFMCVWLGNGLITAPGFIWKRSIKKLAGTFTGSIVGGYQEVYNAQAQKLVDNLKKEVGAEPFDILHKHLSYTTMEALCQTALGVNHLSEDLVTPEYYKAFERTLQLLIQRGVNVFIHLEPIYRLTPAYWDLTKCVAKLKDFSNKILAKRQKEFKEMKEVGTYDKHQNENGRQKFRSFLDILLELKESDPSMTEEQISSEVDTIILAGQETVATTMQFVFLMLGGRPDVQEKLYLEVKSIFGDSKRPVEKKDLAHMPYCEALLNETMRLYPPIPAVSREADRDLKLQSCTIPKGTSCIINIYGAGRSRHMWGPDAQEFKPERWLNGDVPPPPAFLSFSYGKRSCIGKRYAMALMKTVLIYCVRELEFESSLDQLKIRMDISLKTVSGHLMQVRERKLV